MTEKKTSLAAQESKSKDDKTTKANASEKATVKKSTTNKTVNKAEQSSTVGTSKLAIAAIIIALVAPASHYFWQSQQSQKLSQTLTNKISQETSATLAQSQQNTQALIKQQDSNYNTQLAQIKQQVASTSQTKINELTQLVAQLEQQVKQRQPSDWLIHEAEYLIRIAARTLWLEHDTSAAIGLLNDADARLEELNDPSFLSVRELIHQDIKSLEMMPKLQTDDAILSLMAMKKQVNSLPLAVEELGKNEINTKALELSDDVNDWQSNLTKTWQKFLNDFIRVRQRSGTIEPLIAPEQQENLKQNLSLKIQLAIWAASERKGDIYQKSLSDIELWLHEFYAMEHPNNQQFMKSLLALKELKVNYHYANELASLKAIRTAINQPAKPIPAIKKVEPINEDVNGEDKS